MARPILAAFAIVTLVTVIRLAGTVDSDVAWQLWIGQRMLAGAHLYRDILENNPPLWFWMALPVDRLAALLEVRPEAVLIVTMGVLVALSLAAGERLVRGGLGPRRRTLLFCYGAFVLSAMPWMHIGQREQIVLIATFPYAMLVSARRQRERVPLPLAIGIGAGAALGFALKHYFLITPLLLEVWLLTGLRRAWHPIRSETVTIGLVGSFYAAAVILFEGDYFTNVVPLVRLAYGEFGAPSLRYLLGPYALVGLALLFFVAAHSRSLAFRRSPLASAMLVSAAGFTAAYFIQFKGWPYHSIPLVGCASLALAALLVEVEVPWTARILAPALLITPFGLAANEQLHPVLPSPDLIQAVSGLRPKEPVGFLTTESAIPWSVTLQGGYRYPSRYMSFWMMGAVVHNERLGNPDPRVAELGRRVVAETVSDFTCLPPKRIIISRPRPGENGFDILAFFLRDPRMAELLSHYRVRSRTSLQTNELSSPLLPPNGRCRSGI